MSDDNSDKAKSSTRQSSKGDSSGANTWPPWLHKCKDFIGTCSIVIGIIVAVWSLISIESDVADLAKQTTAITGQTEAMIEQNAALRDHTDAISTQTNEIHESATGQITALAEQNKLLATQVEALWYSNRPVLRIHGPNPARDVVPFTGVFTTQVDTLQDSSLLFNLRYTIENVSASVAVMDSSYHEVSNNVGWMPDTTAYVNFLIPPQEEVVDIVNMPLYRGRDNLVKIVIIYRWDGPIYPASRFVLRKCFDIRFEGAAWRAATISLHEFENRKQQQIDAASGR